MKPLTDTLVEYIDGRLDAMLRAPQMWGTDEALELQVLQLVDLRALTLLPESRSEQPRATLDAYFQFLRRRFPEAPVMNLAALLELQGRRGELATILAEFRAQMAAAVRKERTPAHEFRQARARWASGARSGGSRTGILRPAAREGRR